MVCLFNSTYLRQVGSVKCCLEMHFWIALRKVRWIISYSLRGLETRLRFCSSSSRLVSPGPQFGVSYIFFARLLPPTVADQGLEAAAVVVRLVQPGGENEIILTFLPPLNSPTSAPSSSPAPQTPISRPAIDPGAAPCACGCTFIVHAGHRGAKHNHVRKPKTFHTTLNFLKTRLLPEKSRLCQENARVCLCFGPSRFQNLVVIIFPPCCCVRHHHDLHPPRCQHHTACPAT